MAADMMEKSGTNSGSSLELDEKWVVRGRDKTEITPRFLA